MPILVFNAGSATLKFALFARAEDREAQLRGVVERFGSKARMHLRTRTETGEILVSAPDHAAAARLVLGRATAAAGTRDLVVGHRFVHGGAHFRAPLTLTVGRLAELEALASLAPLHMAPALAVARCVAAELGATVPTIAVFDTAYFAGLPERSREYALPRPLAERYGLCRYGFHGLAHRSLYEQWCSETGADARSAKVITIQLGQGCSAAAIAGGNPVDTSMGFTPLEGLVMGTRCGDVDAGILVELLRRGLSADELDDVLERRSGLRGLSGVSGDMRELLELERTGHAGAHLAIDVFCHRVRKYIGAYLAALGGADAIVVGGGIGEHAWEIRARCLRDFEWAGLRLDPERNQHVTAGRITTTGSSLHAWVLHTDEERVIAADTRAAVARAPAGSRSQAVSA